MTNKRNERKNTRPVPYSDLEYIVFKGNANKLKKGYFCGSGRGKNQLKFYLSHLISSLAKFIKLNLGIDDKKDI
ncbi:MAG: hypothetical protein U0L42_08130 [Methanobrevibacter sp.]|uniref:hypothetical protein n=1 Tax=Methanobrevibacter sp. TaxID=66852 RepID=UPI002E77E08D|nr:hypothetical protein [Methanobrevibacter sp.]MEE0935625.1 hypothetical protein [Methanobrevibacter sp.]